VKEGKGQRTRKLSEGKARSNKWSVGRSWSRKWSEGKASQRSGVEEGKVKEVECRKVMVKEVK
jgi:hypothetical protein